ncbi:MAG: apolipoprotein N-acyltransferase [Planctomycetota bacterium]
MKAPPENSTRQSKRRARPRKAPSNTSRQPNEPVGRWYFKTLALGVLGGLLCYLAQPPAGLSLLAWIGPTPWLMLVRLRRLPGPRPYLTLYACGVLYWLATIQWLRLPHALNVFALAFVATYLGVYLPIFVALSRAGVHRWKAPLWIVGPVVWTGLDWVRAHLLTGFLMASLAHTQSHTPLVIQLADLLGEYGVTFVIVLVAAAVAEALPTVRTPPPDSVSREARRTVVRWRKLTPAAAAIAAACGYGAWRMPSPTMVDDSGSLRVALIQSDMKADWKGTPQRDREVMRQQIDLSQRAIRDSAKPIDLVVWPETMFRHRLHTLEPSYEPPEGLFLPNVEEHLAIAPEILRSMTREFDAAVLVGVDRTHWQEPTGEQPTATADGIPYNESSYNSAVLVDRSGRIVGTYDKMHLLPFGEYIPLAEALPSLSALSPITGSAARGKAPTPLLWEGVPLAVNICYESALPHVIRRQMRGFVDGENRAPGLMVNLTNDAWYWGSSELDMHLACGVFRAVEMRTPLVIAANRGLSAHIDRHGRIRQVTKRDAAATLVCDVDVGRPGFGLSGATVYARYGDWFALACVVCCVVLTLTAWRSRKVAS